MIIADTSIWIEFFKAKQPYFSILSDLIENNQVLAVECIFAELLQGAKDVHERKTISDYWKNLPKFPEKHLFLNAGLEAGKNRWPDKGIGLIDSAVIIMARETQSNIWTLDKKLLSVLSKSEIYDYNHDIN